MSLREQIQKHPLVYVGSVWVAGLTMGISGFCWLISSTNQSIISNDKFKTNEQIKVEYTPNKEYLTQKALAETYKTNYQDILTKYLRITSSEPMPAIQIGGIGYQTIDGKKNVYCSIIAESTSPVYNNTDVYKFDDYYYIFKYDKNKTKNQLEADIKTIHSKNPELECEIIDLRKHCPSGMFVEAEDFANGTDTYICKTCK